MKSHASEKTRHLVLRGESGDMLPESLTKALDDLQVACGWMRGSGVLADVQLRAFDSQAGAPAGVRRIAGPVQAIALEGSVGFARGEVAVGLRAVLARETDRGMETFAGEIVAARIVALEALVTAFDDLVLGRAVDPFANVMMLGEIAAPKTRPSDAPPPAAARQVAAPPAPVAYVAQPAPVAPPAPIAPPPPVVVAPVPAPPVAPVAPVAPPPPVQQPYSQAPAPSTVVEREKPAPAANWSDAISASADAMRGGTRGTEGAVLPPRISRVSNHTEGPIPEAGDVVEHFAFGRLDVVKSDGERLHLRGGKDGRVREIALEMLKVTPLDPVGEQRRFRLDRKL